MKLEVAEIKKQLSGQWLTVVETYSPMLSGTLQLGHKGQPCPICGGNDRFNYDKNFNENGLVWCRGGGCGLNGKDTLTLLQMVNGWDFKEILAELASYLGIETSYVGDKTFEVGSDDVLYSTYKGYHPKYDSSVLKVSRAKGTFTGTQVDFSKKEENSDKKFDNIMKIINGCVPTHKRLSHYLETRGLQHQHPETIMFHPALFHSCADNEVRFEPAMVCVIQDPDGDIVSLQRIFLDPHSYDKSEHSPQKMLMPSVTNIGGSSVRLGDPKDTLNVAEGIETALAIQELTKVPTWATITAGGMKSLQVPVYTKCIKIWADNDEAGVDAAQHLANRLTKEGKECYVYVAGVVPA